MGIRRPDMGSAICGVQLFTPKHTSEEWYNLGTKGGTTVDGETYSSKECYARSVELDPKRSAAWYNLGMAGGGTVHGETLSIHQCNLRAVETDPLDSMAWNNLFVAHPGPWKKNDGTPWPECTHPCIVFGKECSKCNCLERALQLNRWNEVAQENLYSGEFSNYSPDWPVHERLNAPAKLSPLNAFADKTPNNPDNPNDRSWEYNEFLKACGTTSSEFHATGTGRYQEPQVNLIRLNEAGQP